VFALCIGRIYFCRLDRAQHNRDKSLRKAVRELNYDPQFEGWQWFIDEEDTMIVRTGCLPVTLTFPKIAIGPSHASEPEPAADGVATVV